MKLDNLTDLIGLLVELNNDAPDPGLEEGQVYTPDGNVITL